MARIPFEKIMTGLEDALAYAAGDSARGTAHEVKVADVDTRTCGKSSGCPRTGLPPCSD